MTTSRDSQLFLHFSNRFEKLATALAADLTEDRADPLLPRPVVVSSAETARWLSMQIAQHAGLAMGLRFPFPRGVIDELMTALLGGSRRCSPRFGRDAIAWWAYDVLPTFLEKTGFEPVRAYLRDGSAMRRFELARRVASLFDQYQVYRPELLRSWDRDEDAEDWQAILWRSLRTTLKGEDSFVDLHAAVAALDDAAIFRATLPSRLRVFGLNTIPPAFLDILWKASLVTRIDFYVLSPTDQYWSDLPTLKQRLRSGAPADVINGNRLALSLGRLGREMIEQLLEKDFQPVGEFFETPSTTSLLSLLQNDLLEMRDGVAGATKPVIDAADASIQIHSCHGHMREVEVLHDHLLALLQDDPALRPRDILVMAPDIEVYAPYIQAVFGNPENDSLRVPWSLADQSNRARLAVADALMRVLDLGMSRFEVTRVIATLECEPVRRSFGLDEIDLQRIRRWLTSTGVVWGLDGHHRERLGFSSQTQHTFAHAEESLLAGYALDGRGPRLLGECLPFADLEGDHLDTLDRYLGAIDALRRVAADLQTPRDRSAWASTLGELAQRLFGKDPLHARDFGTVQSVIAELAATDPGGAREPVPAEVIVAGLEHRLQDLPSGGGFLDGRVTFCSLKPMRAIPARVLCLLGMNDGEFPRQSTRLAFDRIASAPRRGDRSLREDDRHLFFEALLGARDQLYISHRGQSHRDTADAQPASVVVELIDYLRSAFHLSSSTAEKLGIRHALQAFSPRYFVHGSQHSFSRANASAAARLAEPGAASLGLFSNPLPEPDATWRTVDVERLGQFFSHPARRLCEWRLGLSVFDRDESLAEHEPLRLDSLAAYQLRQAMAESALRGENPPHLEAARAVGQIPAGDLGRAIERELQLSVDAFVGDVRRSLGDAARQVQPLRHMLGPWSIVGSIDSLYDGVLHRFRCASLKPKDQIQAWVLHVLINLVRPGTTTRIIDRDGQIMHFRAPDQSRTTALATDLLDSYWRGLCSPLNFFPATSLAFAEADFNGKNGIQAALNIWLPNPKSTVPRESEDPWVSLAFGDRLPLEEPDFITTARTLLGPLLEHRGTDAS